MILLLQQLLYKPRQEELTEVKYSMVNGSKLAFIGAGKMVSAMVSSLLRSGSFKPEGLICCSANDGTSERLSNETGILRAHSIPELLAFEPDVLILGCKPQQLAEISSVFSDKKVESIILSIMAGITLGRLSDSFPDAQNVIRSMPNTPGQIGEGITGFVFLNSPNQSEHRLVTNILSSLGESFELKSEEDIDRITAISGSGPAYLFEFTCALECAAKEIGLPESKYLGDAKAELFLDIYNFGNLLDEDSGQIYGVGYLGVTKNLDASYDADSGTWTYSNFDPDIYNYVNGARFVSVYKMQLGFKLSF